MSRIADKYISSDVLDLGNDTGGALYLHHLLYIFEKKCHLVTKKEKVTVKPPWPTAKEKEHELVHFVDMNKIIEQMELLNNHLNTLKVEVLDLRTKLENTSSITHKEKKSSDKQSKRDTKSESVSTS